MSFKVFRASASSFEPLFLSNHRAKLHDRCSVTNIREFTDEEKGGVLLECDRLAREHGTKTLGRCGDRGSR